MAYAGRLAIIAGGLGGLGTATAKMLQAQGAKLALLYAPFEASRVDSILNSEFGSSSSTSSDSGISVHECDITSESSVQSAFSSLPVSISKSFPSILINAAGYVSVQPFEQTTSEEATKNIIPNLLGPFHTSKAFFHLYRSSVSRLESELGSAAKTPPGRIVSISSQAAHVALDGHGPYCASKAGLNGLTRCMALEWGGRGITSNTVSPTVAMTVLGRKAWADPEKKANMLAQIPTGKFAEPADVAEAVEFLCRDESSMINGADIRVDGGFTIR